jgi:hypothetical protein
MKRRELLVASAGGVACALFPSRVFPATSSRAKSRAKFQVLWEEGHVASYLK